MEPGFPGGCFTPPQNDSSTIHSHCDTSVERGVDCAVVVRVLWAAGCCQSLSGRIRGVSVQLDCIHRVLWLDPGALHCVH